MTKQWINDRLPTEADANEAGYVLRWTDMRKTAIGIRWKHVLAGDYWMPQPEPPLEPLDEVWVEYDKHGEINGISDEETFNTNAVHYIRSQSAETIRQQAEPPKDEPREWWVIVEPEFCGVYDSEPNTGCKTVHVREVTPDTPSPEEVRLLRELESWLRPCRQGWSQGGLVRTCLDALDEERGE